MGHAEVRERWNFVNERGANVFSSVGKGGGGAVCSRKIDLSEFV